MFFAKLQAMAIPICKPMAIHRWQLLQRWLHATPRTIGNTKLRPERPFTGVSTPPAPKIPSKSQKSLVWGSAKESPNIPEKVEKKHPQKSNLGYFLTFRVFSGTFLQTLFLRLFLGSRARKEGPRDSCKWSRGSQRRISERLPPLPGHKNS